MSSTKSKAATVSEEMEGTTSMNDAPASNVHNPTYQTASDKKKEKAQSTSGTSSNGKGEMKWLFGYFGGGVHRFGTGSG